MTLTRPLVTASMTLLVSGCVSATAPVAPAKPKVSVPEVPTVMEETIPVQIADVPVEPAETIDLGPLDHPQTPAWQTHVTVEDTPAIYQPEEPAYVVVAEPEYVPPTGTMAPIYDDPVSVDVSSSVPPDDYDIVARKAAYHPSEALQSAASGPTVRNVYTPAYGEKLARAAKARINPRIRYEPKYVKIGYPWGDVPANTGVCTDVVVRTYRALGVDLQKMVHEDMRQAFSAYPSQRIYGLKEADPNIDHRRVVNLEAFFERVGASVPASSNPDDYLPGDIVTWRLSGNEPHTGVVIADRDPRTGNPLVVHNLGAGVKAEDILFLSPPVGVYRFAPDQQTRMAMLALER